MTKKNQKLSKEEVRATFDFFQTNLAWLECLKTIVMNSKRCIGTQAKISYELSNVVDNLHKFKHIYK